MTLGSLFISLLLIFVLLFPAIVISHVVLIVFFFLFLLLLQFHLYCFVPLALATSLALPSPGWTALCLYHLRVDNSGQKGIRTAPDSFTRM